MALRTAWSALMLAAFYPGRSLMHPHPHPLPGGGGPCSGWGEVWLLFPCSSFNFFILLEDVFLILTL